MFTLDPVYSDGMVLQRDVENMIRGRADAGAEVTLTACGGSYSAAADEKGRFEIALPAQPACQEPCEFTLSCGGEARTIRDILFGDVFHITGQSNMELPIRRTYDPFSDVFRKPDCPMIREFRAPVDNCFDPELELDSFTGGCWTRSDSEAALDMSAAGYFFAKTLYDDIKIPIGLVNTSAGGAPIEGRLPCRILREYGDYDEFLDKANQPDYIEKTMAEDMAREGAYFADIEQRDKLGAKILAGESPEGKKVSFPVDISDAPGRVWFYNDIDLPEDFPEQGAMLLLGTMTDRDVAYINGKRVGETGYMYPPRFYQIPEGTLACGRNRIAVLLDVRGRFGGVTRGKRWCLKSGDKIVDLTSGWTMCRAVDAECLVPATFFQGLPLAVYGKTTAPAYGLKFKAMLIYQAESNGYNADKYAALFTRFVEYYRERCGYDIPVISTQLPEFGVPDDSWARLREAQLECCKIPGTAMAVTIGLGESNDLHPINKWDVGKRLAIATKALVYDKKGYEPVTCKSAVYEQGGVMLRFTESVALGEDEGYFETVTGGEVRTVKPAARDGGLFIPADKKPDMIRYAWRSDPEKPCLFDGRGLPVSPFRISL